MRAAIFYSGKFGSTRQYAEWIAESTSLPVFDLRKDAPEPRNYDLLILGTSIIVGRPTIARWMKKHWLSLRGRKPLLFSVSGTIPGHPDLGTWMYTHLGDEIMSQITYIPLRGRMVLRELPWRIRMMLSLVAKASRDAGLKKQMSEGFDYMDRDSLKPILKWYAAQTRPVSRNEKEPDLVPV